MKIRKLFSFVCIIIFGVGISGCAPPNKFGMVSEKDTDLNYGSIIEKSFFIDSSQFSNNKIKITARNVSGDSFYNIKYFTDSLQNAYANKGYSVGNSDEFGIKFDVIVEYSGHFQENLAMQYGFLGGSAGGIAGYRSNAKAGEAIGILAGATLGIIAGSYITDDTYIIIANVTIGTIDRVNRHHKSVTFQSSPKLQEDQVDSGIVAFNEVVSTRIAVFAGGRNVSQEEIMEGVKSRLLSILSDII